jgi:hypothetical protein
MLDMVSAHPIRPFLSSKERCGCKYYKTNHNPYPKKELFYAIL